jgi:hypothetical protein
MTTDQMVAALRSVGACFATSTAKYVAANDPAESKPAYHIHPNVDFPHELNVERVYSQAQLMDWVRTMKAVKRANDQEKAFELWNAYEARWEDK